ncbi:MAG: hypothetical protein H7287_05345 [Thermoleophilia bacterium]|nr:hypothetical protein [Thermoleophilia bacterium]
MFIPRVTALGIGISALATAAGLGVVTSLPGERAAEWGTGPSPQRLAVGAATMVAMFSTLGFGLYSPMRGLGPVLAGIGALAGAAALGAGAGNLLQHLPHAPTMVRAPGPHGVHGVQQRRA